MIICFDLETTGTNPKTDKIIEIAMIKLREDNFEIIDSYNSFINPEIPIPTVISSITNIFDEDVSLAPKIEEIRQEILDFIGNNILLGHNVDFDINFLVENGINVERNLKIDTFFIANFLNFRNESLNLEMLCKHYKIEISGFHRAINDTKATAELFAKMLNEFNGYSSEKISLIKYIFDLSSDLNVKIMGRFLGLDNLQNLSFGDFETIILKKVGVFKIPEILNEFKQTDLDKIDILDYFKDLGNLEKRDNQFKMAEKVFESLDKNKKIVIEAPTGLGKSFAYLIPSIIYAKNIGEKVYVSTNTKTLQDQLFEKDLKFLKAKLGQDFFYTKLKGKSNYLSLKGFFDYILLGDLEYKDVSFFSKISLWLLETDFGELDELSFFPQEYYLKNELTSDRFNFEKAKNIYLDYEFLEKARKSIDFSDLVIINHSLLFSDLENENSILGSLQNIIIDEAHNIEDNITEVLKRRYNFKNFVEVLAKIEKILTIKDVNKLEFLVKKDNIFSKLDLVEDFGNTYIARKTLADQAYKTVLIGKDFYEEFDFSDLLKKINLEIIGISDFLKTQENYDFSREILYFENVLDVLNVIFKSDNSDSKIKILNFSENYGLYFEYTVLSPGDYLKNNFWDKISTCVLTSATLSINNSFDYLKNILNLEGFDFLKFYSDFDYKSQSTLFIPTDLGNIKNSSQSISNFLKEFYEIVGGNTLTLFTSFASIKSIYVENSINLKKMGINLLAQSIGGSKTKILNQFLEKPNESIILGTDSFWEGVDITGGKLKYLIIYKLPFQVPTDPIFQARSKAFKDPFLEYSIPKAIIKLKQGFGRLIRSKNDKGIVILLDDRINTSWGNAFYNAFPEDINIKKGSSKQFLEIIERKG
ncbi:DEAD/DEAH box helicase [Candidatus Gracilibacteria bacterium]|nr:MAG: DEAD/DEAH box helicase [Candidatus Gracilibacteria bacterium]